MKAGTPYERSEMAVYFIADIEVTDPEVFEEYRKKAAPIIEKYGGRYLVRGGEPEAVEGDWNPSRIVVLEFPSEEHLKTFATAPDYEPVAAIRHRSANTNAIMVQGYSRE